MDKEFEAVLGQIMTEVQAHNDAAEYVLCCHPINLCKREGLFQQIKDEEGEGCNIYGFLEVNKVAGNFHFAPGKSFHQSNVHVQDLLAFQKDSYNISHKINKLCFGEYFPGAVNPLDGVQWMQEVPN
ncbi:hypothetical protein C5167_000308 [Papaver somniferum]|uniref:Endoplasmic reticulum vesicle transporter C-terminal domain-containing protein n=1 Tax=Papaver somniferum TaxID=3469 RepID=A0A4Y7KUT0_PAPSO|nr:endoplasmic reticulum-Golgi intermediate compartment protein 3-like [Papaver somniferum]XP_026412148.1 endoplasmic reticulum-Golgi intermediate compartment protein 3-like [Papaver somniferum]RZC76120.1 hypothetical protein C5167_000308 [Papaver somniferum]